MKNGFLSAEAYYFSCYERNYKPPVSELYYDYVNIEDAVLFSVLQVQLILFAFQVMSPVGKKRVLCVSDRAASRFIKLFSCSTQLSMNLNSS